MKAIFNTKVPQLKKSNEKKRNKMFNFAFKTTNARVFE